MVPQRIKLYFIHSLLLLSSILSIGLTPGLEEANHYFIHALSHLKCETEKTQLQVSPIVDEISHLHNESCPVLVALTACTQSSLGAKPASPMVNILNFISFSSEVFEKIHIQFISHNHFARGPPSLSSPLKS